MKETISKKSLKFYVDYMKLTHPEYNELELDETIMKWVSKFDLKRSKKTKHEPTPRQLKMYEFRKVRPIVLERDDYKCAECESTDRLNVHHVKELCNGGENVASNLITLCYKCHTEKHKGQQVYNLMKLSL